MHYELDTPFTIVPFELWELPPSVMDMGANYRFTVADNSIIAKLLLKAAGKSLSPPNVSQTIRMLRENASDFAEKICSLLATYRGEFWPVRTIEAHNKIPLVLRNQLAQLIAGVTVTPTFKANYLALWKGVAAPADGDTTLGTELVRGLFTQRSAIANVAYLDKFWGSSEVGGLTILEIGTFVDGAAGANTGYLLSRVASNIVVGSTETLTCNVQITLTSAT